MSRASFRRLVGAALGISAVGPGFKPGEHDVMLTSYPRSGNTWIRFLVANLLVSEVEVTFATIEGLVPDIYQNSQRQLKSVATSPRVVKSHEPFRADYRRVVYIVRDPRDIALSYYRYHLKKREISETVSLDTYVEGMIAGHWDGFGPWGEHVRGWLDDRDQPPHLLFIRYEDLRATPLAELQRLVSFLELDSTVDLRRAVDRSDLRAMRHLEQTTASRWKTVAGSRGDIPFVGGGDVGEGKRGLSPSARQAIERAWPDQMRACGYSIQNGEEHSST